MPWENGSTLKEKANHDGDENRQAELLLNCLVKKTNIVELRVKGKRIDKQGAKWCEKT